MQGRHGEGPSPPPLQLVQVQHAGDAAVQDTAQSHLPAWPVKATGCPKQVQP